MEENKELQRAIELLKQNELVAIPTETVYGLAANAFSDEAIEKIYLTKNRPATNPLIVHIASLNQLEQITNHIPKMAMQLASHFWPGPLTILFKKAEHLSYKVTAGKETVAVRMPNHPLTLNLLKSLDFPLVAPSANKSNHISPTSPAHVKISLGNAAPYILDGGACAKGIESTIIGFIDGTPTIYRLGSITAEQLEAVLNVPVAIQENSEEIVAPGMFKKHYSPTTKLIATTQLAKDLKAFNHLKLGIIYFKTPEFLPTAVYRILSPTASFTEAASNLYRFLYEMDSEEVELILIEYLPNEGIGKSINDRIRRAAAE